jgi:hypothetical protein
MSAQITTVHPYQSIAFATRLIAKHKTGTKKAGHGPLPLVSKTSARRRYIHGRQTVNRIEYNRRLVETSPRISRDISGADDR